MQSREAAYSSTPRNQIRTSLQEVPFLFPYSFLSACMCVLPRTVANNLFFLYTSGRERGKWSGFFFFFSQRFYGLKKLYFYNLNCFLRVDLKGHISSVGAKAVQRFWCSPWEPGTSSWACRKSSLGKSIQVLFVATELQGPALLWGGRPYKGRFYIVNGIYDCLYMSVNRKKFQKCNSLA